MNLIKPPKLQKGDTVGIIAPSKASRPEAKDRFNKGVKNLESFGLKVKIGKHVFDNDYYGGATLENRLSDLHDFFADPNIKMVMMCVGGHFANLLLDYIDYELIQNNPKIFCGMSDGTLLTNAIYQKTGLVTFYGPNMNDALSMDMSDKMRENFYQTFFNGKDIKLTPDENVKIIRWGAEEGTLPKEYKGWNVIKSGKASGYFIGGYLPRIITMDYAGYKYDMKDALLFFESCEDFGKMFVSLSSLKQRGVFDDINGMIIGYCTGIEDQSEIVDLIKDVTQGYDFPIIQIGELGHETENYSFPIGAQATIDTDNLVISIDESVVV